MNIIKFKTISNKFRKEIYEYYLYLRFIIWLFVANEFFFDYHLLEGVSMLPTFDEFGEIVILNKITTKIRKYKVNDVICIINPCDPDVKMCKRIIHDENTEFISNVGKKIFVPKNHVWVEGDNKSNSFDSRSFGPISKHLIVGKIWFRVWPFKKFGFFKDNKDSEDFNKL